MTDTPTLPAADAAPPTTCIEAEPFVLRVIDDSMEPEFAAGCIIIIDPTGVAKDGAFVLAEIEGEYIFRELRRTDGGDRLVALNDDYPSVALPRRARIGARRGGATRRGTAQVSQTIRLNDRTRVLCARPPDFRRNRADA